MAPLAPGPLARSQRAALRRALEDGEASLVSIAAGAASEDHERVALAMTVRDLLAHSPARDRVAAVLEGARLPLDQPGPRLGDLTLAERLRLAETLEKP